MGAKNEFRVEGEVVWVKLTQGKETCLDLADWEKVKGFRWYASKSDGGVFYAQARVKKGSKKTTVLLHRLVCAAEPGKEIDHEDRNGLNNLRGNLRPATVSQNQANVLKINRPATSKFKGVSLDSKRGRFFVQLQVAKVPKFVGRFLSEIEAARAYDAAALKYFGEFARLNFPSNTGGSHGLHR